MLANDIDVFGCKIKRPKPGVTISIEKESYNTVTIRYVTEEGGGFIENTIDTQYECRVIADLFIEEFNKQNK